MSQPVPEADARHLAAADSAPTAVPVRRLGSAYVFEERIGAGAQGEVWRARREDDPGAAPLAVKLLRAELLEAPGVLDRFLRERATLIRVSSPHVVRVRDMVVEGSSFGIVRDHVAAPTGEH